MLIVHLYKATHIIYLVFGNLSIQEKWVLSVVLHKVGLRYLRLENTMNMTVWNIIKAIYQAGKAFAVDSIFPRNAQMNRQI